HGRTQPEGPTQATSHVVLTPALPGLEAPGGADPALPGVQAQHHLTQGHDVVAALLRRADGQLVHECPPSFWSDRASATASVVSRVMVATSRAAIRSRGTIHDPPTARTAGTAR